MEKWDYCVQGQGHNEDSNCWWMFVLMVFCESQNILLPNLVWWCSTVSQSHADIFWLFLSSRSRSQQGLIWSKYDSFCYIIWAVESLATKLGLIIHHQKPECPINKWDYCVKVQGQRESQNLMFVQISSKPSNTIFKLGLLVIIVSQSVMQKDWFAIFKFKVIAKAHMVKIWQFLLYLLHCWSFCYQTWFDSTLS